MYPGRPLGKHELENRDQRGQPTRIVTRPGALMQGVSNRGCFSVRTSANRLACVAPILS
jgi:hypothetical protein